MSPEDMRIFVDEQTGASKLNSKTKIMPHAFVRGKAHRDIDQIKVASRRDQVEQQLWPVELARLGLVFVERSVAFDSVRKYNIEPC